MLRSSASGKNSSAGFWRKMLKMIWTVVHAGVRQGHPRLLDLLDAHAVVADLARLLQPVQSLERRVLPVDVRRRAVELEQVQGFDAQVFQASLDEGGEVLVVVAFRGVGIEAASRLGRDEDLVVRSVLEEPADELLAAAVAVDVRGVEEVDAEVDSAVQGRVGVVLADSAPPPPKAQVPRLISETRIPVSPRSLYSKLRPFQRILYSSPLCRMTSEYQRALDLGMRRCVPYSTNTIPNRLE